MSQMDALTREGSGRQTLVYEVGGPGPEKHLTSRPDAEGRIRLEREIFKIEGAYIS